MPTKNLCKHCYHYTDPGPEEGLPFDEYGMCAVKEIIMYWDETCEAFLRRDAVARVGSKRAN